MFRSWIAGISCLVYDCGEVSSRSQNGIVHKNPIISYFVLAYAISWSAAFAIAAPFWMRGEALSTISGMMMFPAMLLGPTLAGIVCAVVDSPGQREDRTVTQIAQRGAHTARNAVAR